TIEARREAVSSISRICWSRNGRGKTGVTRAFAATHRAILSPASAPVINVYTSSRRWDSWSCDTVQAADFRTDVSCGCYSGNETAKGGSSKSEYRSPKQTRIIKGEKEQMEAWTWNRRKQRKRRQGILTSVPSVTSC